MQYTVRSFIEGNDAWLDGMCKTFCSMERTAYNLLRDGVSAGAIKAILRERYGVWNARWCQSAINQARAIVESQEEVIQYRIEQCREKVRNTREKLKHLSNPLKVQGCRAKIAKYRRRIAELKRQVTEKSYPRAIFGSRKLLHRLSIASGKKRSELKDEWRKKRSDHLFSVGQANQRGNANTRLSYDEEDSFYLELRNWFPEDFGVKLRVPEYAWGVLMRVIERAESARLRRRGEIADGGLAYSVRVIRSNEKGYQVLISFELDEPTVEWTGRVAGIDINPEGIACTIASRDGNLIATRFFRDNRLIAASKNKRKWVLENLVNRMLMWCRDTYGCNTIAVEDLKFKGAYDFGPRTNYKLSNFMKRKMLQTIKLHALKMEMLSVEVNPAYTSRAAIAKYGRRFGGFNRHQLAAFVIARKGLGYGEAPILDCLPETSEEARMWNHCARCYGYQPQLQTLLRHEPMERKSAGDVNGGGVITELLTAPPAVTSSQMGLSQAPRGAFPTIQESGGRAGRVHPNGHTNRGDGARGYRVSPPGTPCARQQLSSHADKEDNVTC